LAEALLLHNRQTRSYAMQNPAYIDINHLIPFVQFECFQQRKRHDTRVVDDNIQLAEFALCKTDEGFNILAPCL
jgi:hypothetical protein